MDEHFTKWVEVHVEALEHNLQAIKGRLEAGVRLIAVVKADAYGLGAVEVARHLVKNDVNHLAVTFLREALELREHGIEADILIFAPLSEPGARLAIENDCAISVGSLADLARVEEAASRLNKTARIHVKVDTGLGRFGATVAESLELAEAAYLNPVVFLEGIYTHFAEAGHRGYTMSQFDKFTQALNELEKKNVRIPVRHCCNSTAFLKYPFMHLDAVRVGTLLGGQYPAGNVPATLRLQDPFHFKARITSVRRINRGSYLGYFRTYRLRKDADIAVIPVGFYDGLGVEAAPRPSSLIDLLKILLKIIAGYFNLKRVVPAVMIRGRKAYIRGKIFMQMALVEIPEGMEVRAGEIVEVPVKRTMVSRSVPRIYCKEGEPGKIEHHSKTVSYTSVEE